jgi:hypothetical protein
MTTESNVDVVSLENDGAEMDAEGWALVAPFGQHPKTRIYRDPADGQVKEQKFIQSLDNDAADAILSRENSLFGRIKRALIGLPVFKGHGDLNEYDPAALGNSAPKVKLGVVDSIRKAARGIEAHFALDNDGAAAVAAGWKFPSVLWQVLPNGRQGDAIVGVPFKLLSVALTQRPNISGVESLANARDIVGDEVTSLHPSELNTNQEPDMKLIAGWLLANGIALANTENPTEIQVLEGMKQLHTAQAGNVTTLANEKSTLTGAIKSERHGRATLCVDLALVTGKLTAAEKDAKIVALENSRDFDTDAGALLGGKVVDRVTTLANEITESRKLRAELTVDLAIQKGKLTVAQRDEKVTALANSADEAAFKAESDKLFEAANVVRLPADAISGKQANGEPEAQALANEYNEAIKAELPNTGQNIVQAHQRVMSLPKYKGLAGKLVPKKA